MRVSPLRPEWEERHPWAPQGHLTSFFFFLYLLACSTYAPVKSFLRVDKDKVSVLLGPLRYSHLNGNSADLTPGVPGPVAQASPSTLPEPAVSPSVGMPDLHRGCKEPGNTDEQVHGQAWRHGQTLLSAWPESLDPKSTSCA